MLRDQIYLLLDIEIAVKVSIRTLIYGYYTHLLFTSKPKLLVFYFHLKILRGRSFVSKSFSRLMRILFWNACRWYFHVPSRLCISKKHRMAMVIISLEHRDDVFKNHSMRVDFYDRHHLFFSIYV